MVRPIMAAALALLTFVARTCADLDFTPTNGYYLAEATRVPNLNFHDGSKVISYSPPGGWIPGGAGKKMTLTPPDMVQASASIEAVPAGAPPAKEENLKVYGDMAVALLPRDASKVQVVGASMSSMSVCGHAMVEVTMTYQFFGQDFETVIFFMPRAQEAVRMRLSCRSADFKELYKKFQRSLFSLQGL